MMRTSDRRRELGVGWAFPVRIDANGRFAMVEAERDVQEAIRIILGTGVNERVMRPEFGSEVPQLLFEAKTSATADHLERAIRDALAAHEPRIDVLEVSVAEDEEIETRLVASLSYRLRENNAIFNQVFPLYLREGSERP
ncbi:MAG: GPW/gp25 family protein [Deltaproteobacteria bacterium]|jgi:phage baseplate assembly protein W